MNVVKRTFHEAMKRASFLKKAGCWYRDTEDTKLVANLQRSNFGEQYYVNLAVWIKELGQTTFPKEHECHVRIRASALDSERQKFYEDEVFNLEHGGISEDARVELLTSFLESTAVPFLLSCGSLSELRRLYRGGRFKNAAVLTRAQQLLQN